MSKLSENIKKRMHELKLTQTKLAEKAGISQVTVHKLVAGKITNSSRIVDIARALESPPEWLQYGVGEPKAEYLADGMSPRLLPLIDHNQVFQWLEGGGENHAIKITEWEIASSKASYAAFWLKVVGDSMASQTGVSIPEGHLILVDTTKTAKNGNLVIARLKDSEQILFKQLVIDAEQTYLKPLNSSYKMIEIDSNCTIFGVVLEAKIKLC